MNLAKSLIVSTKTILITAHLCSETAVFTVLLYCLLDYCKHFTAEIAVELKAITCLHANGMNESNCNQECLLSESNTEPPNNMPCCLIGCKD
jgi:hypothetical protein